MTGIRDRNIDDEEKTEEPGVKRFGGEPDSHPHSGFLQDQAKLRDRETKSPTFAEEQR
jgi:hypothetical protein